MDKIFFKLPNGASYDEIFRFAQNNDVTLSESEQRGIDACTIISVAGSIASLIQFFFWIKEKYGKSRVIKVGMTVDGETEEHTVDYLIGYLKNNPE